MTRQRPQPERPMLWLTKYLTLALTLPASVIAGFLIGSAADHWLHLPVLRAVGIILGMAAGLIQVFKELNREATRGNKQGPPPGTSR